MTLAIILLLHVSSTISFTPGMAPHPSSLLQAQSAAQDKPASAPDAQSQPASPSSATGPQTQPAKPPYRKKKKLAVNCNSTVNTPSAGEKTSDVSANPAPTNQANGKTSKPKNSASSNCPPQKTIVKQGGTTEPAIQLVGAPGGTSSVQERDTSQKLQSTEDNLKKMESEKLDSNQQDMIKQIRQFMHESKTATAAGDLERASTLADKAKLLSEELLNPQQ